LSMPVPNSVRTNISINDLLGAASQPLTKLPPPPAPRYAMDGDRDGLALADQNDQSFAVGDTRVQQIALQHGVLLPSRSGRPSLSPMAGSAKPGHASISSARRACIGSSCPPSPTTTAETAQGISP